MGTPKPGTIQQPDLGYIYIPRIPRTRAQRFWSEWGDLTVWLLGITLAFTSYNIGAYALGRFFLDHFHLWNRVIPSDASKFDKHGELIAAFLAGWLSTPAALGLLNILAHGVDEWLERRKIRFRFLDHLSAIVVAVLLTEWSILLATGAMLHPRFRYVDPVSLFGVYWFGSLLLMPTLGSLAALGYGAWRKRRH
ncbi:hypothetical protein DL96DRAFT_1715971 [Flagelloscypha sp. PMI_526]|nr:hypothetical protein DL96DRAFT_1715971 [Flagelloscypha sp. PMI_526]